MGVSAVDRIVFFDGQFYEDEANKLVAVISQAIKSEPFGEPITLSMSSSGGTVSISMGIARFLMDLGTQVNTVARGRILSAGLYPFLAGKERSAYPDTIFGFHEMTQSLNDGNIRQFWAAYENLHQTIEAASLFINVRTNGKLDPLKLNDLCVDEAEIYPAKAFGLGILNVPIKSELSQESD